ncbi:MAG: WecB/TagA/CpsF family glycosyltransferase [Balneolaceae bacterium]
MATGSIPTVSIAGIPFYAGSIPDAIVHIQDICSGSEPRLNRCVSASGAHGVVHARRNRGFHDLLNTFYMNLPDGMPCVWVGRAKGAREMRRCYGPDVFKDMMKASAGRDVNHFLCGGGEGVAEKLRQACRNSFGNHNISGIYTPPFAAVDEFDYEEIARNINSSKADLVWIGISTPKQEMFAARLAEYTDVHFLVTVGAAFDFHIGNIRQAPGWMQRIGLEWFFRLLIEPRRLWKRYAVAVPMFILYAVGDLLKSKNTEYGIQESGGRGQEPEGRNDADRPE